MTVGREHNPAELTAVDVGNAVVPRQPLVKKSVISLDQIENIAVFPEQRLEVKFRFTPEGFP